MEKVAYIVNHYTLEGGKPWTEKSIDIVCYLGEQNKKDKAFSWKFDFNHIDNKNTDVKKVLDNLFMNLRLLQLDGYELKFICEGVKVYDKSAS